jgi:hypothetical protein
MIMKATHTHTHTHTQRIKLRCALDDWGTISGMGNDGIFFSSPPRPDRFWGQPRLPSSGCRSLTPGVKRPGREADHSPTSTAEIKNAWSYTSTPPIRLHGVWCLVRHRDKFIPLRFNVY